MFCQLNTHTNETAYSATGKIVFPEIFRLQSVAAEDEL